MKCQAIFTLLLYVQLWRRRRNKREMKFQRLWWNFNTGTPYFTYWLSDHLNQILFIKEKY